MKAIMVALLACVLVPAVALAQEGQAPGNLNTITGVNVTGGRVEIVGTKKPNFTTFTMTDPPRLVVDISEAVFSGVREDLPVGNGTITGIRTASYGSDESAIARVLIGYEREVETDIQASGNSLVVTIAGGGGAAVAERPTPTPGTAPAGTAPAATAPGASANEAAVAAQVDRQQQEKAAAQSAAAAQSDRAQQEKAAAQSAAAAKADVEAQRQAQARAEADRKAQEEAARVAAQQAEQRRLQDERAAKEAAAAAEKQRQQDEARAAAEQKQRQQSDEKARREAEARAAAEEKKRLAAEEREARREEAEAAAEERRAAAEERRRQQAESRQARVAQAESPRREPEQGDSAGESSRRKTMTLVGFKQEPASSRVFVRTDEPVRYTVTEGNKEVVLELENTRIAESNNTLALNTAFFDTAVASVDPSVGPSRTVRVSIKLKEQVTYETRQEGNEVSIEFQRPSRR